jgi:hypothetical protein
MNQPRLESTGDLAIATPADARLDMRLRDIVDRGLMLLQSSNTMSAFEYLKSRDVDSRVIERVLLDPYRRRARQ